MEMPRDIEKLESKTFIYYLFYGIKNVFLKSVSDEVLQHNLNCVKLLHII